MQAPFHIAEASMSGLFRTILLIIGAIVALRFIGQLMIARRNLAEQNDLAEKERKFQRERQEKLRNFGKVTISKTEQSSNTQDVDFEEIK